MKLKCPECKATLNADFCCKNQHHYFMTEGVLQLMNPAFKEKLESWLASFEESRLPVLKKLDFETLPASGIPFDKNIWTARVADLRLIKARINDDTKTALDIGSWNGWLANQLTKSGLQVTALDYFVHELDGMKAKKFYQNPHWTSIQMDLEDLTIINQQFDLIILNRCFPYFTDTNHMINSLLKMLSPNGQLIITGLNVVHKKTGPAKELQLSIVQFKKQYGKELRFKPFKGFVDRKDIQQLKDKCFEIFAYQDLKNQIKKILLPHKLVVYFGIFVNSLDKNTK